MEDKTTNKKTKKEKYVKFKIARQIGLVLFVAIIVLLFYIFIPVFKNLSTEEGRMMAKDYLQNLGLEGGVLIILLEAIKVLVVMLPGEPIELLSGMCYGPIVGLLIVYTGIIISTCIISLIVRKLGKGFVKEVVSEDNYKKVDNYIKTNPDRVENTLFILYFLPLIPKDFLTYIGNLLPIGLKKFLFISLIARFPAVVSSTIVGARIVEGDIKSIIIVYVISYLVSFSIILLYKLKQKMNRYNTINDKYNIKDNKVLEEKMKEQTEEKIDNKEDLEHN